MRTRLVTALALAGGLTVLALPSSAAPAPKPQITDPAGDSKAPQKGMDIVSGLFATSGTGTPGTKGYVAKALTITLTYAGDVTVDPGAEHEAYFTSPCGEVKLQAYDGSSYGSAECLDGSFEPDVTVAGSTLTFTVPFSALTGLKVGSVLTDLRADTTAGDPFAGISLTDLVDEVASADNASSTESYKVA